MSDVVRLKKICKEIPVELEGEKNTIEKYTIRELIGRDRNTYLNKMRDRIELSEIEGKVTGQVKNFDGMQLDLLEISFLDSEGKFVSAEDIEALPAGTQEELFKMSQKLSKLDEKSAKEMAKND